MTIEEFFKNSKLTVKFEDGKIIIYPEEKNKKNQRTLGDVKLGSIIEIGGREYIVLEHAKETTAIMTTKPAKLMQYGTGIDWRDSNVRKYCNKEFYDEIVGFVGARNIIEHTVHLAADDGSGADIQCKDNVSILTADLYRRYAKYLNGTHQSFWTATRLSYRNTGVSDFIKYVTGDGLVYNAKKLAVHGVFPFLILLSSAPVFEE